MALLHDLANFVCAADATKLPELDRTILRRHACDIVVARLAGGASTEGRELAKVFGQGSGFARIAGLAGLVRLTEMDDIHVRSNTTPSSVAVPVALALAAQLPRATHRVETAIHVGIEVLVRMGLAIDGARAMLKGFWPTRTAATLAASATAAHLWQLTLEETHEALSLAATMTHGRTGRFFREPSGRWIVFSAAVENGLRAAHAARCGFNGGPNAPSAEWLSAALGADFDDAPMLDGLGQGSVLPEISLKPYGTARQCLSAAEAMRALIDAGLDPRKVQKVTIHIPSAHIPMVSQGIDPAARATSFVSVAAQVATAALAPQELYDIERSRVLQDPAIAGFAQRCEIVGDPELDAMFPDVWGARLDVVTPAGQRSYTVLEPLGAPANRMDDAALAQKAQGILSQAGLADQAERMIDLGRRAFEEPTGLAQLSQLFVEGAPAPEYSS
jgi:2-methylcitrate dehydratase PrpD